MSRPVDSKITIFVIGMAGAFLILFGRLYFLQVINGKSYVERSESNFIQERLIKHSRGKIFDSESKVLADNRLSYDLYVTFAMLPDSFKYLRALTASLPLSRADLVNLDQEILQRAEHEINEPLVLADKIDLATCDSLEEMVRTQLISGVELRPRSDSCELAVKSTEFPSQRQSFLRLRDILGQEDEVFKNIWQRAQKKSQGLARFKPNLLMPDIGFDAYVRIENAISLGMLAGVNVSPSKRRRYVHGDAATHVIGFLNQISQEELKASGGKYRSGDFVGRRGVEATFENELRGQDGIERVIVDAKGRRFNESWEKELLGENRIVESRPGVSVKLSINLELQKAVQEYFNGISGSIVVMEAKTGFIKALASFPSFDPNIMVSADNNSLIKALMENTERPFRNKALQDHYSPGSTFKPITAIAGLSKQLISSNFEYYCSGNFKIHRTNWRCFKREGHGHINMFNALKVSCDGFFYDLGYRLGIDNLANVARIMGFGEKTGIPLLGETPGILPSREYYKKRLGFIPPGAVVNMSIGQGDLNVTPLQLAVAYSAIANGGTVYQPQLVSSLHDDQGYTVQEFMPVVKSKIADNSFNLAEISGALAFVAEPGGSASGLRYNPKFSDIAKWLKENNFQVVGKTGTAQVVKLAKHVDHLYDVDKVPYKERDHAWFVGLFPREDPEIVIVVMTEHGGFASTVSAPAAVRIMKKWHEMSQSKMHTLEANL